MALAASIHDLLLDGKGGSMALADAAAVSGQRWLHLDYTRDGARRSLDGLGCLKPQVVEALLSAETRPRCSRIDSGTLILLRGVNLTPGAAPEDMISIRLWLDGDLLVSSEKRRLQSLSDVMVALGQGDGPQSLSALIVRLVEGLVMRAETVISQLEDQLDDIEEQVRLAPSIALRHKLTDLRRRCIVLQRFLSPQRDAIAVLSQEQPGGPFAESERLTLREAGDRLQRLLDSMMVVREHATLAAEDLEGQQADRLNQRMYLLAVITGIFLPVSVLTGLFGVNVGGMPGLDNERAFAFLAGSLLVLMLVVGLYMRRNRWL